MSRCHHGYPICESWQECPQCCAEHDAYEAADAARSAAEELQKQTRLMEEAAYERPHEAAESAREREQAEKAATTRSVLLESQQLAIYAEERSRMADLHGAILLMQQAIDMNPSFIPFYYQRAKYLLRNNRQDDALSDLKHCFQADPRQFEDTEMRLRSQKLDDFSPISAEVGRVLAELKDEAKRSAASSLEAAEQAEGNMRASAGDDSAVLEIVEALRNLRLSLASESYTNMLRLPSQAREITRRISAFLDQKTSLKQNILAALTHLRGRIPQKGAYTDEVDAIAAEVATLLGQAEEHVQRDTMPSLKAASALVEEMKAKLSVALRVKSEIDAQRQALEWAKRSAESERLDRKRREEKERQHVQARRNNASKTYAWTGAYLLGLLGGLAGCIDCANHLHSDTSSFTLFTGAALGALIGAILGALMGQMKR